MVRLILSFICRLLPILRLCNKAGGPIPAPRPISAPVPFTSAPVPIIMSTVAPTPVPIQLCPPFIPVNVSLGNNSNPNGRFQNVAVAQSLLNMVNCLDPDAGEEHTQTSHVWWNPGPLEVVLTLGNVGETFTLQSFQFWNFFEEFYDVDSIGFRFLDKNGNRIMWVNESLYVPKLGRNSAGINTNNIIAERIDLNSLVQGVSSVVVTFNSTNGQIDFQNILFVGFQS